MATPKKTPEKKTPTKTDRKPKKKPLANSTPNSIPSPVPSTVGCCHVPFTTGESYILWQDASGTLRGLLCEDGDKYLRCTADGPYLSNT